MGVGTVLKRLMCKHPARLESRYVSFCLFHLLGRHGHSLASIYIIYIFFLNICHSVFLCSHHIERIKGVSLGSNSQLEKAGSVWVHCYPTIQLPLKKGWRNQDINMAARSPRMWIQRHCSEKRGPLWPWQNHKRHLVIPAWSPHKRADEDALKLTQLYQGKEKNDSH